jgi:hypothetical protein
MLKRYTNLRPEQLHRVTLGLPKQKYALATLDEPAAV